MLANEPAQALPTPQHFMLMGIILLIWLHWAVFQHLWVALVAGVVLSDATWFVVRAALRDLEEELRWSFQLLKLGSNQIFRECS